MRVIWYSSVLQSAFCDSIGSVRDFKVRFVSHLIQNWASKCVQFGTQSAFCESFGSARGFRARFASQLVQFGDSERVSRVNWFS